MAAPILPLHGGCWSEPDGGNQLGRGRRASLADRCDLRLLLTGGVVTPEVGGCVDATSVLAIQQMNIDRCFLGVCSLSGGEGISAFDPADVLFKRALIARSRAVMMMVATDKLGTRAPQAWRRWTRSMASWSGTMHLCTPTSRQ